MNDLAPMKLEKARPHWHSENDLGPSQNVFARPHCNR